MTKQAFLEMIAVNEPLFTFHGKEYQICAVENGFVAGNADDENEDEFFQTVEAMLENWMIDGVLLIDALPEISI